LRCPHLPLSSPLHGLNNASVQACTINTHMRTHMRTHHNTHTDHTPQHTPQHRTQTTHTNTDHTPQHLPQGLQFIGQVILHHLVELFYVGVPDKLQSLYLLHVPVRKNTHTHVCLSVETAYCVLSKPA